MNTPSTNRSQNGSGQSSISSYLQSANNSNSNSLDTAYAIGNTDDASANDAYGHVDTANMSTFKELQKHKLKRIFSDQLEPFFDGLIVAADEKIKAAEHHRMSAVSQRILAEKECTRLKEEISKINDENNDLKNIKNDKICELENEVSEHKLKIISLEKTVQELKKQVDKQNSTIESPSGAIDKLMRFKEEYEKEKGEAK